MRRARVGHEVRAGPWESGEEFLRERVALESVAGDAGGDEVAGSVRTTVGDGHHVVEGGELVVEPHGAVDAAAATVAEGGALERALVLRSEDERVEGAPDGAAGGAGKCRAVSGPTGQGHLAGKDDAP